MQQELAETGSVNYSYEELLFGCKTAWRNASRCIGRIQWNRLHMFDCRRATTTREMFDAAVQHIRYAQNEGNIRWVKKKIPVFFE